MMQNVSDYQLEPWQDIEADTYDPDRITNGKAEDIARWIEQSYDLGRTWTPAKEHLVFEAYQRSLYSLALSLPERRNGFFDELARPMTVEAKKKLLKKIGNYDRLLEATKRKLRELENNPPVGDVPSAALKIRRVFTLKREKNKNQ